MKQLHNTNSYNITTSTITDKYKYKNIK